MEAASLKENKEKALDFLQLVIAGKIDAAYQAYVDMQGKHHNPFFPAGFTALKTAMLEDQARSQDKQITVVNVVAEGDLVAVHSHLKRGADDMAVVHLFRFKDGRIVELWDCGQTLLGNSPNSDGAF